MRLFLHACFGLILIPLAANAASAREYLVIVASSPLWQKGAQNFDDVTVKLDGKQEMGSFKGTPIPVCGEIDRDDGWICKLDASEGRHEISVHVETLKGQNVANLQAVVNLVPEKLKTDDEDRIWCASITTNAISLMRSSDERCHTD
jgi:hypothetical protein